jgi:hypothetical protein
VSKRRSSGAGLRRESGASARGLLTRRQWVLFSLAAAVVGLQLLILWRFAVLAAGSGAAAGSTQTAAVLRPLAPSPIPNLQPGQSDAVFTVGDGGQSAAGAAAGWEPRLQLLASDVDVMRRRLELLAADVGAAVVAAAGGPVAAAGGRDSACAAGTCPSDAA